MKLLDFVPSCRRKQMAFIPKFYKYEISGLVNAISSNIAIASIILSLITFWILDGNMNVV